MRNILVTGGAGFIGSNFIKFFFEHNDKVNIINLDALTYAGNLENLDFLKEGTPYSFIEGDICDEGLVFGIFEKFKISDVIHFAAESHVDNSISSPRSFIQTNVLGTYNLLAAARKYWINEEGDYDSSRFIHVSTDEVFGSLGSEGSFTESSPYLPNSPYSSSKASSDMIVRSFYKTYGLKTIVTNCSNNFGPRQHSEKLIPKVIEKALRWEPIPIYGSGANVRDWLYVNDHCKALDIILKKGTPGQSYLIGGRNEKKNLDIAKEICSILDVLKPHSKGSYSDLITHVEDRLGHDFRYSVDASKLKRLGWYPSSDFKSRLVETVEWYLNLLVKS